MRSFMSFSHPKVPIMMVLPKIRLMRPSSVMSWVGG